MRISYRKDMVCRLSDYCLWQNKPTPCDERLFLFSIFFEVIFIFHEFYFYNFLLYLRQNYIILKHFSWAFQCNNVHLRIKEVNFVLPEKYKIIPISTSTDRKKKNVNSVQRNFHDIKLLIFLQHFFKKFSLDRKKFQKYLYDFPQQKWLFYTVKNNFSYKSFHRKK